MKATRLEPEFVPRPWGSETWFRAGSDSPLLIKFLETFDKLSVQVHPPDSYARRHENSSGKTEMWHITAARPGAQVAVGFRVAQTRESVLCGIRTGEIESQMNWLDVRSGDTIYVEAGRIHTIGAGVSLCEIQQNSDVTYRLYDYGRKRELHLEKGLDVCSLEPYDGRRALPVRCEYFHTEEIFWTEPLRYHPIRPPEHFLVVLSGSGTIGNEWFEAGHVWFVEPAAGVLDVVPDSPPHLLRSWRPY
ncbi:MAG TPA: class I mannose-6-phosphate isomerase [Bryobacteraceae bacterium]|nr:class I mannose-6-phosphate isomerase [Bryobacteraceae bacterium]